MKPIQLYQLKITPTALIRKDGKQRVDISYKASASGHLFLSIFSEKSCLVDSFDMTISGGEAFSVIYLSPITEDTDTVWKLYDLQGGLVAELPLQWKKPREWTLFIMLSSHTDIGLHNSQFIQRYNSERFIDQAAELCDKTDGCDEYDRYRYVMEGTWFWSNYGFDRGREKAEEIVQKYVLPGKMGIFGGVAGNHTHIYGLEEMCRSACSRQWLKEQWGVDSKSMTMIDNNGLSWAMVQPYVDAGYENILFAPNQWNPLPSASYTQDHKILQSTWNTEGGGGASRIDLRYGGDLPMVFYWRSPDKQSKLLVWASGKYDQTGAMFGFKANMVYPLPEIEDRMAMQFSKLEEKYPYDVWLVADYSDDQAPDTNVLQAIEQWNAAWEWPKVRTLGNPDQPFALLKNKFDQQIPVLEGEIVGGWYQHPLSTPELVSDKFAADRLLPTAEKWSVVAAALDSDYTYPTEAFDRAWAGLVCNDEHSYGTSGYQGSRVFETWMQHRDWIEKAQHTAETELSAALQSVASHISVEEESVAVFNPTLQERNEWVSVTDTDEGTEKFCYVENIPPMGYVLTDKKAWKELSVTTEKTEQAPMIENDFYRLQFTENGAISSIYDKKCQRELINRQASYGANEFVFTKDNHQSFITPQKAKFTVERTEQGITVLAEMEEPSSGAFIEQRVTLYYKEKKIGIENRLLHVRNMFNTHRYYRYCYYAFPFAMEHPKRLCHLNGCIAEYGKDLTGHSTDVYFPAYEWCCVEQDGFGIGFLQKDSQIVEFDHIHSDKSDYGNPGEGGALFVYLANDWLQMHAEGGSHLNYCFRYEITSYQGDYRFAQLAQMAERFTNPVTAVAVNQQQGSLGQRHSFLQCNLPYRLLTWKRASDGNGTVVRLYSNGEKIEGALQLTSPLVKKQDIRELTINEQPKEPMPSYCGFRTLGIGKDEIYIQPRKASIAEKGTIGRYETGLITYPRAHCGEHFGMMYLLWGQNMEENLVGYRLYRGEVSGFSVNENHFVADVAPGVYRVVRYEDRGLKMHTRYFYRVCAVFRDGTVGAPSIEFSGYTREDTQE